MTDKSQEKWPDLARRRKTLRLAGFDYSDPDHVFFVTLCARDLRQPFLNHSLSRKITDSILLRAMRNEWQLYAYCLMPDHLHLAVSPEAGSGGLIRLLQSFKSYTTRLAWQHGCQGALWQRSYYDHVARREEDLLAICEYIVANPVRAGLVSEPGLWPYSGTFDPLPL